jgi:hypothetical protein
LLNGADRLFTKAVEFLHDLLALRSDKLRFLLGCGDGEADGRTGGHGS